VVTSDAVDGHADRLTSFLQRYIPKFYRVEQSRAEVEYELDAKEPS
jgi:hypothetical protein